MPLPVDNGCALFSTYPKDMRYFVAYPLDIQISTKISKIESTKKSSNIKGLRKISKISKISTMPFWIFWISGFPRARITIRYFLFIFIIIYFFIYLSIWQPSKNPKHIQWMIVDFLDILDICRKPLISLEKFASNVVDIFVDAVDIQWITIGFWMFWAVSMPSPGVRGSFRRAKTSAGASTDRKSVV